MTCEISRKDFIKEIRALGYKFKKQKRRAFIYKKSSPTVHVIVVPKSAVLKHDYMRVVRAQMDRHLLLSAPE